jgi:hypothetical protein
VKAAGQYLGCIPILNHIAVWYSDSKSEDIDGSQRFHLDHEDYRQVKGFLFINDIDMESGPLNIVPSTTSRFLEQIIKYRMTPEEKGLPDEKVFSIIPSAEVISIVGKSGDMAFIDTSHCFHYGSRQAKNPRLILMFQYVTPFAFINSLDWRQSLRTKNLCNADTNEIQKYILGELV